MATNLHQFEAAALPLLRAVHPPMIGEGAALPLLARVGATWLGNTPYEEILCRVMEGQ